MTKLKLISILPEYNRKDKRQLELMFNLKSLLKKFHKKKGHTLLERLKPNNNMEYWEKFGFDHSHYVQKILNDIISTKKYESEIFHLKQLIDDNYRKSYNYSVVRIISHVIECMRIENNSVIKVADFACWSGITSRYLSNNFKVSVTGIEVNPNHHQFANKFLSNSRTKFSLVKNQNIQLGNESQDIVFANAAFANIFPIHHKIMIKELVRILKPNGIFLLMDSNNPNNLELQKSLKTLYANFEKIPDGSFFNDRKIFISSNYPNLKNIDKVVSETCYYRKNEIDEYLKGVLPPSIFKPDSLKVPVSMSEPDGAPSNPTDPKIYKEILSHLLRKIEHGSIYLKPEKNIKTSCFVLWGQK